MLNSFPTFTPENIQELSDKLIELDPDFSRVVERFGYSPHFGRTPGFPSLILIILEQQVSLASARAAYNKLLARLNDDLRPETFLTLSDEELKTAGFSRQKTRYGRELANAILTGQLNMDGLIHLPDEKVRTELIKIKGIGVWTANIYLMMCLNRIDIWPTGDIALEEAIKQIKGLDARPKKEKFEQWGEPWRPYRSIAAHLLWHYYLSI
ncbi:MAG: DNA-3-methyladenine glycosylase 2 family protein [Chloroflexota bacterium]